MFKYFMSLKRVKTPNVSRTRTAPEIIKRGTQSAAEAFILVLRRSGDLDRHIITGSCQSSVCDDQ